MQIPIKVVYDDGREVRTVAKPRDVVEFERRYRISYSEAMATRDKPGHEEWWYFLAWSPLHRAGQDTRDFEPFIDSLLSVEVLPDSEDEKEPVPFAQAPTDESSLSSPPQE
jgi:hypothetical protein